jgi:hypothetical protein
MTAALSAKRRARARCIRAELARLLRQSEGGQVCLLDNADNILQLAKELVEVEDSLDTLMIMTL